MPNFVTLDLLDQLMTRRMKLHQYLHSILQPDGIGHLKYYLGQKNIQRQRMYGVLDVC